MCITDIKLKKLKQKVGYENFEEERQYSSDTRCVPGLGSAIFLHCPSADFGTTAGCVAIPEENMIVVMQLLQADCVIIIDAESEIFEY